MFLTLWFAWFGILESDMKLSAIFSSLTVNLYLVFLETVIQQTSLVVENWQPIHGDIRMCSFLGILFIIFCADILLLHRTYR
jgi:hypothetical protein